MGVVEGLSHITFIVRDLDRVEHLLTEVLGAEKVYDSGTATFLPPQGAVLPDRRGVDCRDGRRAAAGAHPQSRCLQDRRDRLPGLPSPHPRPGTLQVRDGRPRIEGEGCSIYFYDHDNHLFELHTGTLQERLARYEQGNAAPPACGED